MQGLLRIGITVLVGLWGADVSRTQETLPPPRILPADQSTPTTGPANKSVPSLVFPDGGFPVGPTGTKVDLPTPAPPSLLGDLYPEFKSPGADYAPPGVHPPGEKDAPGALLFRPLTDTLPSPGELYVPPELPSADYFLTAVGPHEYADYAPPGYEAREGEEGQVPGVPEFTPITVPVPVTPEEREKFLVRGLAPGSFIVPGTNTSFRFRGFVRLTGLYDFNPIGSRDDFVTNTIPVPQTTGQNYNMSARYSRIGLDTWTPTPICSWNVHTFIEADYFNGPAQAVGGGGNPFRLRFAFADFGYFRIGQQNSVFMDSNAFPVTVDFAGPRGLLNQRRPGVRVTIPVCGDRIFWAAGIEQPFSDITTNGLGVNVQDIPDFATHLRYEGDVGHVQLSSLVRSIGYRPTGEEVTREAGWGVSASTVFHPWAILTCSNPVRRDNPNGLERCRILLQYSCGWGIGRYIQDSAGLGLDGQVDPATGSFKTLWASGWSASYEHWFTERWLTNITYSQLQVGSNGDQPGNTYVGAKYLAASLWFVPVRNMSLGIEYVWGERKNLGGGRGQANRANALFQYNF